jgi:hypothetical protein
VIKTHLRASVDQKKISGHSAPWTPGGREGRAREDKGGEGRGGEGREGREGTSLWDACTPTLNKKPRKITGSVAAKSITAGL